MGLADDLNDSSNFDVVRGGKCATCELLKELDKADKEALMARLNDPKIGHTSISDVLKKNGIYISRSGIARHRKDCNGAK
jgi:hypothetical protein